MRIFNHKFNRKILRLFFSTHPMLLFNRFITSLRQGFNFNTSYVAIQLLDASLPLTFPNFNTSYVVIQQVHKQAINVCLPYFNT